MKKKKFDVEKQYVLKNEAIAQIFHGDPLELDWLLLRLDPISNDFSIVFTDKEPPKYSRKAVLIIEDFEGKCLFYGEDGEPFNVIVYEQEKGSSDVNEIICRVYFDNDYLGLETFSLN